MLLQIIETLDEDGPHIRVRLDGQLKASFKYGYDNQSDLIKSHCRSHYRTYDEAMAKAREIFQFIFENNGAEKIIEEVVILN